MKGAGIDLVEIDRIKKAYLKFPEKFRRRIFTPGEQEYIFCHRFPWERLAARFAAKEAVMKALGCGWGRVGFQDIEVINDSSGKPRVFLRGKAAALARELGVDHIIISLSHSREYAVAQAIAC
ncbi:MAG: holo-[acyl-carrier-protein] synthase [Candidatus Syntrophonatronum acetioxidans]|uniref:Holo-[acyl-carrier-protein] synthase n=1 Tax=Candidatus Syntrophonatronum acetioxidans TaxID=1795816 RepID=A0A424YF80_9FIRM|nr:MAG: holo-[acyl-carrier-protein] synthase [Candidatus Syntrophonatronum acetioxidans]